MANNGSHCAEYKLISIAGPGPKRGDLSQYWLMSDLRCKSCEGLTANQLESQAAGMSQSNKASNPWPALPGCSPQLVKSETRFCNFFHKWSQICLAVNLELYFMGIMRNL